MDTKDRIILVSLKLFAERGFYGASMDSIAKELGLSKQALIHHFGSKEKLYGCVLEAISNRLMSEFSISTGSEAEASFVDALIRIYHRTLSHNDETKLLMRELLDNSDRASRAEHWYLRPFLDALATALRKESQWAKADDAPVAARVYQLLGAINYFAISMLTLEHMYTPEHVESMEQCFAEQLRVLALSPSSTS